MPKPTHDQLDLIGLVQTIANCSWKLGQVEGLQHAAAHLMRTAGEAFVKGQDDTARLLREQAKTIEALSQKARTEYDTDARPQREVAWTALERLASKVSV